MKLSRRQMLAGSAVIMVPRQYGMSRTVPLTAADFARSENPALAKLAAELLCAQRAYLDSLLFCSFPGHLKVRT